MERHLCRYWEGINLVSRASQYYETTLKGCRGVTKGNSLAATTFNIVVNTVISHESMVAAWEDVVPKEFGISVQSVCVIFSMYNRLLYLPCPDMNK